MECMISLYHHGNCIDYCLYHLSQRSASWQFDLPVLVIPQIYFRHPERQTNRRHKEVKFANRKYLRKECAFIFIILIFFQELPKNKTFIIKLYRTYPCNAHFFARGTSHNQPLTWQQFFLTISLPGVLVRASPSLLPIPYLQKPQVLVLQSQINFF